MKPKKPRKKTKPSALTRPPKKGKKKKNQKKPVRPQKPIPPSEPTGQSGMYLERKSLCTSGEQLLVLIIPRTFPFMKTSTLYFCNTK